MWILRQRRFLVHIRMPARAIRHSSRRPSAARYTDGTRFLIAAVCMVDFFSPLFIFISFASYAQQRLLYPIKKSRIFPPLIVPLSRCLFHTHWPGEKKKHRILLFDDLNCVCFFFIIIHWSGCRKQVFTCSHFYGMIHIESIFKFMVTSRL